MAIGRLLAAARIFERAVWEGVRVSEILLDVKGLSCPLPVLRANKVLRGMQAGEKLRVLATDRAAVSDFRAYCQETGHALLAFAEEAGVFSFTIRRRPDPAAVADDTEPPP